MGIGKSRDGGICRIELDGTIDVSCAADLKALLLDALAKGQEICVSLGKVSELDATAIQLLWAASREGEQRGVKFGVLEPPDAVRESLGQLGLPLAAIFGSTGQSSAG